MVAYLIVGLACGSAGVVLHALMAKVKVWDATLALAAAMPEIARRFETDAALQRACYNYSAASVTHACEIAAMIAALDAYENAKVGVAAVVDGPQMTERPRRRYTDRMAEAERHARESGGSREQGD